MKNRLPLFFLFAGLAASIPANAQQQPVKRCGTYEYMQEQLANDPAWAQRLADMEQEIGHFDPSQQQDRAVITIPVVFHVVYKTTAENISSSRLTDQIAVLNQDYRKLNADVVNVPGPWQSITADMEIQFCLATIDPQGNPTTGIERVQTTVSSFIDDDKVKSTTTGGANAWDRNRYLNLWVCHLGGGILGYAQFPGGNAATDGVVLSYQYVGTTGASPPYNKGRTATHEIGHWLSLYHIWGDDDFLTNKCTGSDNVTDTPNQEIENYGCPTYPLTDACTTTAPGVMFMNYMDYTDDACMYMFTAGQKTRAQSTLSGSRATLRNNAWYGCGTLSTKEASFEQYVNVFPNPSTGDLNIRIDLIHPGGIEVNIYDVLGNRVKQASFDDISSDNLYMDLSDLSNGVYFAYIIKNGSRVTKKVILDK
jgi:hypothetical protein